MLSLPPIGNEMGCPLWQLFQLLQHVLPSTQVADEADGKDPQGKQT